MKVAINLPARRTETSQGQALGKCRGIGYTKLEKKQLNDLLKTSPLTLNDTQCRELFEKLARIAYRPHTNHRRDECKQIHSQPCKTSTAQIHPSQNPTSLTGLHNPKPQEAK